MMFVYIYTNTIVSRSFYVRFCVFAACCVSIYFLFFSRLIDRFIRLLRRAGSFGRQHYHRHHQRRTRQITRNRISAGFFSVVFFPPPVVLHRYTYIFRLYSSPASLNDRGNDTIYISPELIIIL